MVAVFGEAPDFDGLYPATPDEIKKFYNDDLTYGGSSLSNLVINGQSLDAPIQDWLDPQSNTGLTYQLTGVKLNLKEDLTERIDVVFIAKSFSETEFAFVEVVKETLCCYEVVEDAKLGLEDLLTEDRLVAFRMIRHNPDEGILEITD